MKASKMFGVFLALVLVVSGCEKKEGGNAKLKRINLREGGISIEAEVSRGFYSSYGIGSSGSSVEYVVDVKIINNSSRPVSYTMIQSAFIPCQGTPLISRTYAYNGDDSRDLYGKGNDKAVVLAPHGSDEFHPATNGYTMNLLRDAGSLPLQFKFTLFFNNTIVAGPFTANLPSISELSSNYSERPKYRLVFF